MADEIQTRSESRNTHRGQGNTSAERTPSEANNVRALAARPNYLAQGKPYCAFVAKELCRECVVPTVQSFDRLDRLCNYLLGYLGSCTATAGKSLPDATPPEDQLRGWGMIGGHCLKHLGSTQSTVSLSSAEAELPGIPKGMTLGIGVRSIAMDLGLGYTITVISDASAAVGITRRRGLGRVRRLDV